MCDFASGRLVIGWMIDYDALVIALEESMDRSRLITEYLQDPGLIDLNELIPKHLSETYKSLSNFEIIRTDPIFKCNDKRAWYYLTMKVHPDGESYTELIEKVARATDESNINILNSIASRLGTGQPKMRIIAAANLE